MLEKHLQQSRTTFFSRYKHLLAGVVIGLMIAGLFVAQYRVDWSSDKKTDTLSNKDSYPNQQSNNLEETFAESNEEDRDLFKKQLRGYELNLEPTIFSDDFTFIDPKAKSQLANTKNTILSSFGEGDYPTALDNLNQLIKTAEGLIQDRDIALDQAVKQALQAIEKKDIKAAEKALNQALLLAPASSEVSAVSTQVELLPQIVRLQEEVHVSRIENNHQAELDALQALSKLQPDQEGISTRITTLQSLIKARGFEEHIRKGTLALDSLDLEGAHLHLKAARLLDPNRGEVTILSQKISTLADKLETQHLIKQAEEASADDDWEKALQLYIEAAKISPNVGHLKVSQERAQHIVTLGREINGYLRAPHRLSSPNVSGTSATLIHEASQVADASPNLVQSANNLSKLLKVYNKPIDVMILSDQKTFVQVRGVGKVGKVKSKLIQLKPGQYNFEGTCDGYHSVLLPVLITPESNGTEVRVTCNEPL